MPPMLTTLTGLTAYRARYCIPLAGEGPARGTAALMRPPHVLENAVIVVRDGYIQEIGTWKHAHLPAGTQVHDAGDVCLIPPVINAHTHLQLSSLAGKTLWHAGFVPWLRSLIPLLAEPLDPRTLADHVQHMHAAGTACVGDYTGHNLGLVHAALHNHGLDALYFAEWFGFDHAPWNKRPTALAGTEHFPPVPPAVAALLAASTALPSSTAASAIPAPSESMGTAGIAHATIAPAGHALYSTQPEFLQRSHRYCQQHKLPFSLHLAESPEEDTALCTGTGSLVELYAERVLPHGWRAPGLRPVPAAAQWGLLGPNTLAIHGVQCTAADRQLLAHSHTSLCLCPRSNEILQVGTAPVPELMAAGIPLCLGTDGLTSAPSLNVWEDAHMLWTEQHIAPAALLRMLTVNGAHCLHKAHWGSLEQGKRWAYCTLPAAWGKDFGMPIRAFYF